MEELMKIAAEIGTSWRWLGRVLKLEDPLLDQIDYKESDLSEKCYQTLLKWRNSRASRATREELARALSEKLVNRNDLAEHLRGMKVKEQKSSA